MTDTIPPKYEEIQPILDAIRDFSDKVRKVEKKVDAFIAESNRSRSPVDKFKDLFAKNEAEARAEARRKEYYQLFSELRMLSADCVHLRGAVITVFSHEKIREHWSGFGKEPQRGHNDTTKFKQDTMKKLDQPGRRIESTWEELKIFIDKKKKAGGLWLKVDP